MASLEQVIRPFQSPQPFGIRRVIATSIKIPEQTAGVTWGSAGTLPSAIETAALGPAEQIGFNTKKEDDRLTEKKREVEKIKITQEDNPDNFVVYERPKRMTLGPTDPTKQPTFLTKKTAAAPDTQTAPVRYGPLNPEVPGETIPVTQQGGTLWVDKRNLPSTGTGDPVYLKVGDTVWTFAPRPLAPNETVVP